MKIESPIQSMTQHTHSTNLRPPFFKSTQHEENRVEKHTQASQSRVSRFSYKLPSCHNYFSCYSNPNVFFTSKRLMPSSSVLKPFIVTRLQSNIEEANRSSSVLWPNFWLLLAYHHCDKKSACNRHSFYNNFLEPSRTF